MASFNDYITADGERMLAKAVAGTKIKFTKCILGSGYMKAGTYERNVYDVIKKEVEIPIQSVTINAYTSVLITAYFNNKNLSEGFYFREKGIYMSDGEEEVLAIYGNNGSEAEYIDTGDVCVVEKQIKSVLEITDQEKANIEIVDALYEFAPVIEAETETIHDFIKTLKARTMKVGQRVILNKKYAYTYVGDDPTDVDCYVSWDKEATYTRSGIVKLTDSSAVTDSTGLALPATEKNASITGTLANQISQLNTDITWKWYNGVHTNTVDLSNLPNNTQEIYFAVFIETAEHGKELVPFVIPYCTLVTEEQSYYGGMYNNANSYVCAQLVATKTSARIALFNISGVDQTQNCTLYVLYK